MREGSEESERRGGGGEGVAGSAATCLLLYKCSTRSAAPAAGQANKEHPAPIDTCFRHAVMLDNALFIIAGKIVRSIVMITVPSG